MLYLIGYLFVILSLFGSVTVLICPKKKRVISCKRKLYMWDFMGTQNLLESNHDEPFAVVGGKVLSNFS